MAGIANERRMISRSPMGLVRCSAVWRIFADRRIVMSSSVLGSESCVNVKKRGGDGQTGGTRPKTNNRFTLTTLSHRPRQPRAERWGGHVQPVIIGAPIVNLVATNG
jgi:hypothetical protein